jgi:hypothetical protein
LYYYNPGDMVLYVGSDASPAVHAGKLARVIELTLTSDTRTAIAVVETKVSEHLAQVAQAGRNAAVANNMRFQGFDNNVGAYSDVANVQVNAATGTVTVTMAAGQNAFAADFGKFFEEVTGVRGAGMTFTFHDKAATLRQGVAYEVVDKLHSDPKLNMWKVVGTEDLEGISHAAVEALPEVKMWIYEDGFWANNKSSATDDAYIIIGAAANRTIEIVVTGANGLVYVLTLNVVVAA